MGKSQTESGEDWERAQAQMDRLYQEMLVPGRWVIVRHTHAWRPPTDVYETDEDVIIRVEVAGMKETDFSVTLTERVLVITGVRQDPRPKVAYHQMEIRYGEFRTEVYLHWAVDEHSISAHYANGFLQVVLPKAHARRVPVVEAGNTDPES